MRMWPKKLRAWIGTWRADWVLAMTTIIFATLTWQGMLDNNRTAQRALDRTERAWVIALVHPPTKDKDGHWTIEWTAQNIGKSLVLHLNMGEEFGFDESPPVTRLRGTDIPLPPNSTAIYGIHGPQTDAVLNQDRPLYLWFFASYSDPFGTDRFSRDCFIYTAPAPRTIVRCSKNIVYR